MQNLRAAIFQLPQTLRQVAIHFYQTEILIENFTYCNITTSRRFCHRLTSLDGFKLQCHNFLSFVCLVARTLQPNLSTFLLKDTVARKRYSEIFVFQMQKGARIQWIGNTQREIRKRSRDMAKNNANCAITNTFVAENSVELLELKAV